MGVSPQYQRFVLEQLGRVVPVASRAMFGGVGIYTDGLFFALISDDALYLKVDESNRADFEAVGSGPFRPYGDERAMQYYELPGDVLEDVDALGPWITRARAVAASARRMKD